MSCFPLRCLRFPKLSLRLQSAPPLTIDFPLKQLHPPKPIETPTQEGMRQYCHDIIHTTDGQLYITTDDQLLSNSQKINETAPGVIAIKALSTFLKQAHRQDMVEQSILLLAHTLPPSHPMWSLTMTLYGKLNDADCAGYLGRLATMDDARLSLDDIRSIFRCLISLYINTQQQSYLDAIQSVWEHYKARPYVWPERGWVVADELLSQTTLNFRDDALGFLKEHMPHYSQPTLHSFDHFFKERFTCYNPEQVPHVLKDLNQYWKSSKLLKWITDKQSIKTYSATLIQQCRSLDTRRDVLRTILYVLKTNPSESLETECVDWIRKMAISQEVSQPMSFDHLECVLSGLCNFHQEIDGDPDKKKLVERIQDTIQLICNYYIQRSELRSTPANNRVSDDCDNMSENRDGLIKHRLFQFLQGMAKSPGMSLVYQSFLKKLTIEMATKLSIPLSDISFLHGNSLKPADLPLQLPQELESMVLSYAFFKQHPHWAPWSEYLQKQTLSDDTKRRVANEANTLISKYPNDVDCIHYCSEIIKMLGSDFVAQHQEEFQSLYFQSIAMKHHDDHSKQLLRL